jgi:hypothetical protein
VRLGQSEAPAPPGRVAPGLGTEDLVVSASKGPSQSALRGKIRRGRVNYLTAPDALRARLENILLGWRYCILRESVLVR